MTDQPPLFKPPKPVAMLRDLTARQQRIYDLIKAAPDGLEAAELGALIHAGRAQHASTDRCQFCGQTGARALKERAIKQRVIKQAGRYRPRDLADRPQDPTSQLTELPDDLFGTAA